MWHPGPEILTVSQHAEVDRLSALGGTPLLSLMENAGRQVANEIAKRWPATRTLVLCGPGNNGGDGYVVARHLAARGFDVEVLKIGEHGKGSEEARKMAAAWKGVARPFVPGEIIRAELVVDAIFGAGLSRGLSPELSQLFEDIAVAEVPVVAVDVPSGINGDTAAFMEGSQPWNAALCVTFFRKKPAHVLLPGRHHCGEVVCTDIGIGDGMISALAQLPVIDPDANRKCEEIIGASALPALQPQVHKHVRGHCFVFSGPATMTGAARLSAMAALRTGAGLVTVLGTGDAVPVLASQLTAVMLQKYEQLNEIATILSDPRPKSVVAGPGMGVSARTRQALSYLLSAERPAVIDADGLTAFEGDPPELFAHLHENCVLTPHVGEFRKLFPGLLERAPNRIRAVREAARQSGAVVLLKGPDTVISAPNGDVGINTNAPPQLATAGSGDVLAGIIGGLLAQGMGGFEAAKTGAFLHGECGRLAGRGLIAEDLPALLPAAMATR
jgi:ADP-dependent NAD(P)H-hydrate dehydratase / NAD(P)H-hydrate epimerase